MCLYTYTLHIIISHLFETVNIQEGIRGHRRLHSDLQKDQHHKVYADNNQDRGRTAVEAEWKLASTNRK